MFHRAKETERPELKMGNLAHFAKRLISEIAKFILTGLKPCLPMSNVSEIVMVVPSRKRPGLILRLTQIHVDVIFWVSRGFTYNDMECMLPYSYTNMHHSRDWLYEQTLTCNAASLIDWAHVDKVLVETNGVSELNKELMVKKESG